MKKIKKWFLGCIIILLLIYSVSSIDFNSFPDFANTEQPVADLHSSVSTSDPLKFEWYEVWGDDNLQSAHDMVLDSEGNVYLTGIHYTTWDDFALFVLKYSHEGVLQWSTIWNEVAKVYGSSISLDSEGNIYVAGNSGLPSDVILIKFNSTGDYLWHQIWDNGDHEEGSGVIIDEDDFIYVVGMSLYELQLFKYTPSGTLVWNKNWNGEHFSIITEVDIDSNGNVLVTGDGSLGILTVKFDSSGNHIWHDVWGYEDFYSHGGGLIVDSFDNIYLSGSRDDYVVLIKYDSSGNEIWNRTWSYIHSTIGIAVELDSQENIYVTGSMYSNEDSSSNYTIIKYSKYGDYLWHEIWGGDGWDSPSTIAIDSNDHIYLAGYTESYTSGGGWDTCLVKFSSLIQISVYSPKENDFFGVTPPQFHLEILELDLNYSWYSLNNEVHKVFFTGSTGTIQQSQWSIYGDGIVNITYFANDSLGNVGYSKISVKKDLTPPISAISYIPHNSTPPIPVVNSSTLFTLNANDINGAGVETIQYQITLGEWINYTHPFKLDNHISAVYMIYFRAIDAVGNIEDTQQIIIQLIDTRPPPPSIPGYRLIALISITITMTILILKNKRKIFNL